jgi:NAD(P)-dependent dehydrogenase (short-subunit alcohol dehydrogenase family)
MAWEPAPSDSQRWQGPLVAGRVAVVTGGGGGVGRAVCAALADHGADVVVVDHDDERLAAGVANVESRGQRALGLHLDLTVDGSVAELKAKAHEAFGRVDILVNGVGHSLFPAAPFEDSTEEQWDALYRVNLLQTLRTCHAFVPGMKERGWGRIVNFSSVEGMRAGPWIAVYTAFKGAIDSFTKSLAVDLAASGVNVNCVAVDKTATFQVNIVNFPEEYHRHIPVWVPAGRWGHGDDIASVVLFLSSDLAAWVVGQTLVADGGTLAAGGWFRTPVRWSSPPLLLQDYEHPAGNAARPRTLQ